MFFCENFKIFQYLVLFADIAKYWSISPQMKQIEFGKGNIGVKKLIFYFLKTSNKNLYFYVCFIFFGQITVILTCFVFKNYCIISSYFICGFCPDFREPTISNYDKNQPKNRNIGAMTIISKNFKMPIQDLSNDGY